MTVRQQHTGLLRLITAGESTPPLLSALAARAATIADARSRNCDLRHTVATLVPSEALLLLVKVMSLRN